MKASADRVLYGPLTLANVQGGVRVKDRRATLDELSMEMLRGKVIASGFYDTSVLDRPTFDVGLRLATVDIPTAFATLVTVQKLAPVARWAQGGMSGTIAMRGALDKQMTPVFTALGGKGDIETERLVVQGLPVLEKLADALSLELLRKPALSALRATFSFADGRVTVKPFAVNVAGTELGVAGSHGIDQTMKYDLTLAVPRSLLGGAAGNAVARLVARAGKPAADLASGEAAKLTAQVTGTFANPNVSVNFAGMAASAREAVQTAVKQEVETRTAEVKEKVDSAAEEARRRAREEADRIIAEAERQAATIRADARALADKVKREGNARADSLLAKATNPAAKMAAKLATDRLRREADQQAERGIREADARADSLVARAKRQADALIPQRQ
jgi:AsmA-like protein